GHGLRGRLKGDGDVRKLSAILRRHFYDRIEPGVPCGDGDIFHHRAEGNQTGSALVVVEREVPPPVHREVQRLTLPPDRPGLEIVARGSERATIDDALRELGTE